MRAEARGRVQRPRSRPAPVTVLGCDLGNTPTPLEMSMSEDSDGAPDRDAERKRLLAYERTMFEGWLDDLAKLPPEKEFMRSQRVLGHLAQIISSPYVTPEELFKRVYGDAGANGFWEVECSEPVKWDHAIRLFAVMLAHDRGRETYRDDRNFNMLLISVGSQFVDAFHLGEDFFSGDTSPLKQFIPSDGSPPKTVEYGWQVKPSHTLKVDIRQAAQWLLSKPKRRQWVPASLADFVRSPSSPPASSADSASEPKGVADLRRAQEWMRANITAPGQWKRAGAIERCRQDTKVTDRVARAAWNMLPDDLRGTRGRRKG